MTDTAPAVDLDALKAAAKDAKDAEKAAKKALDADPENATLKDALEAATVAAAAAKEAEKAAKGPKEPAKPKATPVYSPNRQFTGDTAGITFVNGNGLIPAEHPNRGHLVTWFKEHGYSIGKEPDAE